MPTRVYWVRRLMVLGIAALLVVGFAQLLGGGGGGGAAAPDRAQQVAQTTTPAATQSTNGPSTPTRSATHRARHHRSHGASSPSPVAMPSGPCADNDISIVPSVKHPIAGQEIKLLLDITTISSPACDWQLSGTTLAMKITSGSDLIWTSVQCGNLIPTESLVLRQGVPSRVKMIWNGKRSEPGCPTYTDWALAGTYHLHVAPLAGRPQDVSFLLDLPTAPTVTQTVDPHQHKKHQHRKHHHKKNQHRTIPPG